MIFEISDSSPIVVKYSELKTFHKPRGVTWLNVSDSQKRFLLLGDQIAQQDLREYIQEITFCPSSKALRFSHH